MGGSLAAAAVVSAWTAPSAEGSSARRGGTLRVDQRSDFDFIDPALAYFSSSWQANFMADCKLLNFPDREGAAGVMPQPEVAKGYKITNGGRTYTFSLRPTYRFSNGAPVTAANFKLAFERDADKRMNSPAITFMEDIVGVKAKFHSGARTISGVRVLGKYKLRITLAKPAGDFLSRLALPFFAAVPSGTPIAPQGVGAPRHSCGRYYYQSWDKGKTIVMVRNKFYRGPKPANPDQIVENIGIALDAQRLRCERGDSDICGFPPAQAAELRDKYGVNRGRFFVKGQAVFWYLNFNHNEPLFRGNDRLKQAVNHAIDRPLMVRQHGVLAGEPASQLLPIDFPGFRNWNLYSLRSVPRAQELARGNMRSGRVRFWTFNQGFGPAVAQCVRANLQEIGLTTEIRTFPTFNEMISASVQPNAPWDMLISSWGADFGGPDPYGFVNTLLRTPGSGRYSFNLSYFNEAQWNRRMDQANRMFGAARLRAYSILDRDLMQGPAPMAPYITQNARVLVSDRVKSYIFHKVYGTDFAAISVQ